MSGKSRAAKKSANAATSSVSPDTSSKETEVARAPVTGVDVGQSKVLKSKNFISLMYYRYTLMTGVYMLDGIEQAFLHFFIILGLFFLMKYSYSFYLALKSGGFI
jgi:hypothetical protein